MNSTLKNVFCAAALALAAMSSAQANVHFTVKKISDTSVVMTGSGTLDGPQADNNLHLLALDGLATNLYGYEAAYVFTSSTLRIGEIGVDYAAAVGPAFSDSLNGDPAVTFGNTTKYLPYQLGATVSGDLVMDITSGNALFAPVGTTGNVLWGHGGTLQTVGSYEVVGETGNVPEPASLALLGGGLLAVGAARRSRRT